MVADAMAILIFLLGAVKCDQDTECLPGYTCHKGGPAAGTCQSTTYCDTSADCPATSDGCRNNDCLVGCLEDLLVLHLGQAVPFMGVLWAPSSFPLSA